jgi:four helix bundle protein
MGSQRNPLKEKSFDYALEIIKLYKILVNEKREYVMSKQILRCGTSVGANIREAQNASGKADFIHKLFISQKECDETLYWLELLFKSDYISSPNYLNHKSSCEGI